jgi:hypothetical protein
MSPRGGFILFKISLAGVVVDPNTKSSLDIHVVNRSVPQIRTTQSAACHAAARSALHMLVSGSRTWPAVGFFGIAFVGSQTCSPSVSLRIWVHTPNYFIAVWHDCT